MGSRSEPFWWMFHDVPTISQRPISHRGMMLKDLLKNVRKQDKHRKKIGNIENIENKTKTIENKPITELRFDALVELIHQRKRRLMPQRKQTSR